MAKYRIIKENEMYFPQYKQLGFWFYFQDKCSNNILRRSTEEEAKVLIERDKKYNQKKLVVWEGN